MAKVRELVDLSMPSWLLELWKDFWERTALYPVELGLLAGILVLLEVGGLNALLARSRAVRRMRQKVRRLANRRTQAIGFVLSFALAGHWFMQIGNPTPAPGLHDEYSYLLAADTFAQGRLTNPSPPSKYSFESFHILVEPTYMSMYPPGQGLAMAFGQVLFGSPMAGVWISVAIACAALCWMLQGWMAPRWALLGGSLAAVRIGWFSYWANSYWGGAMAMLGGALVMGGLPRFVRRPTPALAATMAVGAWILLNTRPFEGVLVLLPCALWLLLRFRRQMVPGLVAGIAVLAIGIAWMCYYNWRITGDPLLMPYTLNRNQYAIYKWFVGSTPDTSIAYRNPQMANFYKNSEKGFRDLPFALLQVNRLANLWWFFVGPAFTLALFGLWRSWRGRAEKLALGIVATLIIGNFAVVWTILPHYAAPQTAAFYVLFISGLRRLRLWRPSFTRAAIWVCFVMALVRYAAPSMGVKVYGEEAISWYTYGHLSNTARAKIEARLTEIGGKHLVWVLYDPNHSPHMEWVYNRASIEDAPVVWSRGALTDQFSDRRVWVIRPDESATQIQEVRR